MQIRVAKNTSRLTPEQMVPKMQVSLTAVAEHATVFTGATALLAQGAAAVTGLETSNADVTMLEAQLAQARYERGLKMDAAQAFYNQFALYVGGIANGNADTILLAAMDVALPPGPPQPMTKVEGNRLDAGGVDQTAMGNWRPVVGARYYDVQTSKSPAGESNQRAEGLHASARGEQPGQRAVERSRVRDDPIAA